MSSDFIGGSGPEDENMDGMLNESSEVVHQSMITELMDVGPNYSRDEFAQSMPDAADGFDPYAVDKLPDFEINKTVDVTDDYGNLADLNQPDWETYVDPLKKFDDLKFTYTEQEMLELSKDELMDILSVKTADDVIIYFDLISNIEIDQVLLKDGESIPIASYEKYYELSNKFSRYKMFKLMHDRDDTISSLQKAEQRLEEMIIARMETLEHLFQNNTERMISKIDYEVSTIRDSVMDKVSPAVAELTTIAKNSSRELRSSIEDVDRKIRQLDHKKLDGIIEKLSKVSELLAEVVE